MTSTVPHLNAEQTKHLHRQEEHLAKKKMTDMAWHCSNSKQNTKCN